MTSRSLDFYRENWPRVGAVFGMAVGGATVLASRKKLVNLRAVSAMNLIALAVHQYEEYVDPGYFPGHLNRGVMRSGQPRNYPLNRQSSLCINTALAYPFYIAPIVFPAIKWLGLPPVLFGIAQAVDHGIVLPGIARVKYSPGFLAAILLHVPIGISYIAVLRGQGPIDRSTWRKSIAVMVLFLIGLVTTFIRGIDKNSPYAFSAKQMGHHDAETSQVPANAHAPNAIG
ncbi:MAG TPA: HXXEE domain-containing protein [Mycobacterium sp.]|nr:HXXEE domain-containing protein [Mycobacterium sp.]